MVRIWNIKLGISFARFQIRSLAQSNQELFLVWEPLRMNSKKNIGLWRNLLSKGTISKTAKSDNVVNYIMLIYTLMLTLKTPSLHGNNNECGAKEVNITVSTDFTWFELNWVDQKTQEAIYGNIRLDKNHMVFLMKDSGQDYNCNIL